MQDAARGSASGRERASVEGSNVSAKRQSRRRWGAEEKARVVRESLRRGKRVGEVARRYGISRWQLSMWRSLARQGKLAAASSVEPVGVEPRPQPAEDKSRGEAPATRQFVRWTESAPLVNAFGVWLDEQRSRLGEKLTYIANQWEGLLVFLYDGRVEMDSNFVENRIRPLKLTAKNALFAGHDEGARSWGRIGSLIETCKMNGVEPYAWLKSTLEKIAAGHPQSRIHELLPWNFGPASS